MNKGMYPLYSVRGVNGHVHQGNTTWKTCVKEGPSSAALVSEYFKTWPSLRRVAASTVDQVGAQGKIGNKKNKKKNMSTMVDRIANGNLSNITRLIADLLMYTLDFISLQ
jgi:hypothetical protein